MPKLFASDFDGTLCLHPSSHEDALLRLDDLVAIQDFRQAGGLFGVCTGRPLGGITRQVKGVIPFDFYIAASGATVHDAQQRLVWGATMPAEAVRSMSAHVLASVGHPDRPALYVTADDYWVVGENDLAWGDLLCHAKTFDELPEPFIGWSMETSDIDEAHKAAAYVAADWGDMAAAFVNLASIDVVPAGCSKGAGLLHAAEHFGATLTAGIGDSFNDLPLLRAADMAYTFETAPEEVRAEADVIVPDVAHAIADFMAR